MALAVQLLDADGNRSLQRAPTAYLDHCHHERNDQGLANPGHPSVSTP